MSDLQQPWPPPYPRPTDRFHPPPYGYAGTSVGGPPPRTPRDLAVGAVVAAAILAGLQVVIAIASWPAATSFRQAARDGVPAWDVFTVYDGLVILLLPTMVACYVVTCLWLYRCRTNLDRLAPHLHHARSPIWAWLGWWVPVVCLWFPYQVVRDVLPDSSVRARIRLGWWWAGWLTFTLLSRVTGQLATLDETISERAADALPVLETIAAVVLLGALVPWLAVVRRTTEAQRRLVEGASGIREGFADGPGPR